MQLIKFQGETISGDRQAKLEWDKVEDKDELMVEIFTSEELFEELSMYWQDLEERADTSVYMSFEWAYNWWQHFGKHKQRSLFLITIWDGTMLVGLAPFYKGYSTFGSVTLERRLQIIGSGGSPNEQYGYMDDYGISDFLDIIVDRCYIDTVTEKLLDILTFGFLEVDKVAFHQVREDSYIKSHLFPKLMEEKNYPVNINHTDTCPAVHLNDYDSLQPYIKDQKSSARRRLRQTRRAMGSDEEYVIEEVTDWKEIEKATEKLINLHQSRWHSIGFPGVFYDERFTRFFKDTLKYAHENGWLWFKRAMDEEGVCAIRMALHYQGSYYDYISGFDEDRPSSKYRPGIGLLLEMIQNGINDEKTKSTELLRGEEKYKYDFTSESIKNWKLTLLLRKRRNILLLINRIAAFIYKYAKQEGELLAIQRKKKGIFKMFWGYINFRWKSLKLKLNL